MSSIANFLWPASTPPSATPPVSQHGRFRIRQDSAMGHPIQRSFQVIDQMPPSLRQSKSLNDEVTRSLKTLRPEQRHKLIDILAAAPSFSSLFGPNSPSIVQVTEEHDRLLEQAKLTVLSDTSPSEDLTSPLPASAGYQVISAEVVTEFQQYTTKMQRKIEVVLSLKAKAVDATSLSKNKIAITSVLDVSGSMAGPRIDLLRGTTMFLVDQMTSNDYLGLVSYSSSANEILPLMRMASPESRKYARSVIEGLQADGGTALFDGLRMGMQQILTADLPNSTSMATGCLLCTDGEANEGPATADEILPAIHRDRGQLGREGGGNVYCFGIGMGHDATLLQALSESLSGSYYFLGKHQDIAPGYGDLLASLKSTVAKEITVEIRTIQGVAISKTLGGKKVLPSSDDTASITFSNLFDGESRELLVDFDAPLTGSGGKLKLAEVLISYIDLATGIKVEQQVPIEIQVESGSSSEGSLAPHPLIVATAARYETSELIEAARLKSEAGEVDTAEAMLRSHAHDLSSKLAQVSLNDSTSKEAIKEAEEMLQMLSIQVTAVADLTQKQMAASKQGHFSLDLESRVAYQQASSTLNMQRSPNVGGAAALPASKTYDSEYRRASRASASASASSRNF